MTETQTQTLTEMEIQIPLLPVTLVLLAILLLMVFKMLHTCCCDPPCPCSSARRCSGHCPLGMGREGEDCPAYCPYVWMDCCPCRDKNCCKVEVEKVDKRIKKKE